MLAMRRMTVTLRLAPALILALILALASVHTALARATAGPVTWIEICDGLTTAAVAMDAKGNPVTAHPTCPDCVMAAALLPQAAGVTAAPTHFTPAARTGQGAGWPGQEPPPATARGPPALA
ncbi:MAG: hypothetical protein Q8M59_15445 [Tabrizicola sp.]|nr:hypothetical protein [Tabrizicola sp.]